MYLISWTEEEATLEASLGGRITVEEMRVLLDEVSEIVASPSEHPYHVLIDFSRAKRFDLATEIVLDDIKDLCLRSGAQKITCVVRETDDIASLTAARFQAVMEGTEDFVTDPSVIRWTPSVKEKADTRLAA